jgi:hypothetical protein
MKTERYYKLVEVDPLEIGIKDAFVKTGTNGRELITPDFVLNTIQGSVGVFRLKTLLEKTYACQLCGGKGDRSVIEFDGYIPTGKIHSETCCDCKGTGQREYRR